MLEILLIYFLCKKLGTVLRAKDRNPLPYQIAQVIAWFGGEFAGGFIGAVAMMYMNDGEPPELNFAIYAFALGGAIAGSCLVFFLASMAAPRVDSQFQFSDSAPNVTAPLADPNNPYASPRQFS